VSETLAQRLYRIELNDIGVTEDSFAVEGWEFVLNHLSEADKSVLTNATDEEVRTIILMNGDLGPDHKWADLADRIESGAYLFYDREV
jgi:hypothetical protein